MSLRKSRSYKLLLWLLTIACVGGAGFLGYKTFFSSTSAASELKSGEAAYARGLEAYTQKNWGAAADRFDEARVFADRALAAFEQQAKDNKLKQEEAQPLFGRILWLKARAIRDQAHARGQKEGKPLSELPDPQYNETYRVFVLPDPENQVEAMFALRTAAPLLTADPEVNKDVVKEALRFELALNPISWEVTVPLLRKALELNPKDARANYYLARHEYEQPIDNNTLSPYEKRSADRMEDARKFLAAAKQHGASLWFWRTAGLEAEILDWPVRTASLKAKEKETPKAAADRAAAEKAIDDLLFGDGGLVAAAGKGERLAGIGMADAKGLVSVLTVGVERAAADARRTGGSHDRLRAVCRAALDLANKMAADPNLRTQLQEVGPAVVGVMGVSQPLLSKADPAAWKELLAGFDAFRVKTPEAVDSSAPARLTLARMASGDAEVAARSGDAARVKELQDRAIRDAEAGLKAAEAAKLPAHQLDEFRVFLVDTKLSAGRRGDEIEPHLVDLRTSTVPRYKLLGQFYDARVLERRGRLDQARKLLDKVVGDRDKNHADVVFLAQVLLAGLAQAAGDPDASLRALREVDNRYNAADIPPHARSWADEVLGGQDAITGGLVVATLQVAANARAKYLKEVPGRTELPKDRQDQIKSYEDAALNLIQKLKPPTNGDWSARMAAVTYLAATNRRREAEDALERLVTDYPESIGVLRARCQLLAAPVEPGKPNPNGVAAADLVIRKFLKDYPKNQPAKLFSAEWLMTTGRADEAVKYLSDPETFPAPRDPAVDRALSMALLRTGQREEANKIISKLPADQGLNVLMLRVLTPEIGAKLKESLSRYEDQGMYRVTDGAVKLTEGKFEESARAFASAIEFDRVRDGARSGMQSALVAFAEADPAKGRDAAARLAADYPDEAGPYVAAALAALYLEEIGNPADKWDDTRTMYAAVNKWEKVAEKAGGKPADLAVAKAQFRLLAGNIDGARQELITNHNRNQKHVPTILSLAELSLVAPPDTKQAREYMELARKETPDDARLPYLEANILAAGGDWAGVVKIYEKLAADSPNKTALHPLLVGATERAGDKAAALKWAEEWAKLAPKNAAAIAEVIRLTAQVGRKDDAVKLADDLVARWEKEAREKLESATPPLKKEDVDTSARAARATALLTVAAAFQRAKEYDLAEVRANEAVKTHPKSEAVQLMLGDIGVAREQWDKALAAYKAILAENPRHFIAGNNAAWILAQKMDKPTDALALVETIRKGRGGVPIGPERLPPEFLDTIGAVYVKLNDPARAAEFRQVFEAAVRRYPADPRLLVFYAYALHAAGEKSRAFDMLSAAVRAAGTKNGLTEEKNKAAVEAAEAAKKKLAPN